MSHHTISDLPRSTVSVVIVGQTELALFRRVLAFLKSDPAVRVLAEGETISDALGILPVSHAADSRSGKSPAAGSLPEVDVVIVLQAHSDEYGTLDVQLLIGRMLFGRVVCCYGPWCQADGRTHTIWPVSCRVPVGSAPILLAAEFEAVREHRPPLSPMAAAEEVFVHRNLQHVTPASWKPREFFVVSDDRVLRETVAQLCLELCCELQPSKHTDNRVRTTSMRMARSGLQNCGEPMRPLIVLVDLDPCDQTCRDFLQWLEKNAGPKMVIGITVFAESSFSLPMVNEIFDKLELSARLRELPK